jgi:hypothetical protein
MTYDHDETPEEALERNLDRIRTEGLDAATEAALALLRDPKAPAQAKSATINAIFRASGLFSRDDDGSEVEPQEMTTAQMERRMRDLEALRRRLSDEISGEPEVG